MFISTADVNNFLRSQKFDVARDSSICGRETNINKVTLLLV